MNKQELIEKVKSLESFNSSYAKDFAWGFDECRNGVLSLIKALEEPQKVKARLAKHWDEDLGECLWWNYPIEEPPYCGTPLDDEFPKYKTHFTELRIPNEVEEEPEYLIRVNDMYFLNWGEDGTCPTFVLDDMPGSIAQARKHSKAAAEELAKHLGGTVEKV